ncbi:TonB-dependent receptor plug domain-containing protein [Luteibaculum oceani]|uniref:TonB-dependent receptor n=1 Tax=Luteibaculum oceani TaxID=1294296 RepID=A0A5C6US59_9FLAO|nr:TonB-dependent receptor [Luteibaculum oceani]TXC76067.1 TonB-dependent receptor [Luteibaculum oceani]
MVLLLSRLMLLFGLVSPALMLAQNVIKGKVTDEQKQPLPGASVLWLDTQVGTITDADGNFEIERPQNGSKLVFSYTGFQTDTIEASYNLSVRLKAGKALEEVEIVKRQKTTRIKRMDALKVEQIGVKELLKAACCNLSESFETSPSVDVSFTDAVTGTRQIQMLGLAGPYSQITRENMPSVRGLNAVTGLTYIPGPWLESIQLNKGAGSVVNGFESVTGQINYELQKPLDTDPLFVNMYFNQGGRKEINLHGTTALSDKLATAILVHGKSNQRENDRNGDSFLDMPKGDNLIVLNRYFLMGTNGWRYQLGGKYTSISTQGGQIVDPERNANFSFTDETRRFEAFAKAGKTYDLPWKSLGIQLSGVLHTQDIYAGYPELIRTAVIEPKYRINSMVKDYRGVQNSLYGNFIYQSIIGNTNNQIKTGASIQVDDIVETVNVNEYLRREIVPGAYFELNKTWSEKFKTVSGLRIDHHNNYGAFITPRFHGWWSPNEKNVLRFSGGRGLRTANVFMENIGQWVATRSFVISATEANNPYGLNPEIAWNYGFNYTKYVEIRGKELQLALDFYRTDFENQVVVDRDTDDRMVSIYNLDGKSFANSLQFQVDYELVERLDARVAYRWYDVQTTYGDELLRQPFLAPHRAFINLAYETENRWFFDATVNWQGEKRLAPFADRGEDYSPSFFTLNAQIRKVWKNNIDIYLGAENLLNFQQENPIGTVAIDPRSGTSNQPNMDAASVWGPIFGRNIYLGFRYRINK